jgi:hypothetical protein
MVPLMDRAADEVGAELSRRLLLLCSLLGVSIGCATAPKLSQNTAKITAFSSCVVTLPNGSQNPGEPPSCPGKVWPGGFSGNHGNGKLWVTLPTDGRLLIAPEEDGSLHAKFPWWRGVCGRLTITGRRLDAPTGPIRSSVPGGYGDAGFQASSVNFPSEGCWEITGRVGDAKLAFMVEVRKNTEGH